jgi:hypothetical protein
MTKMLDLALAPGSCGGSCPRVVARPATDARASAGLRIDALDVTSDATPDRDDAALIKMYEAGLQKTFSLYRELVDLEIGRASEYGARWWSRRLVEMYEESGLTRLDT